MMSLTISNPTTSYINNTLNNTNSTVGTALQRLASGLRVNSPSDDPGSYAVGEKLLAQIKGYNSGVMNANSGISLLQIADSKAATLVNNFQRMRELVLSAGSTAATTDQRASWASEYSTLLQQGLKLLTDKTDSKLLTDPTKNTDTKGNNPNHDRGRGQGNAYAYGQDNSSVSVWNVASSFAATYLGQNVQQQSQNPLRIDSVSSSTASQAANFWSSMNNWFQTNTTTSSTNSTKSQQSGLYQSYQQAFSFQGQINSTGDSTEINISFQGWSMSLSNIWGLDGHHHSGDDDNEGGGGSTGGGTGGSGGSGGTGGTGGGTGGTSSTLDKYVDRSLGNLGNTNFTLQLGANPLESQLFSNSQDLAKLLYSLQDSSGIMNGGSKATAMLNPLDDAIEKVNTRRVEYGSMLTEIKSSLDTMQTLSAQYSSARNSLLGVDYAAETANLARGQMLQQTGVAMLAQANATSGMVLSLLKDTQIGFSNWSGQSNTGSSANSWYTSNTQNYLYPNNQPKVSQWL